MNKAYDEKPASSSRSKIGKILQEIDKMTEAKK